MDVSSRIDLFDLPHKFLQIWVRQTSCSDGNFFLFSVIRLFIQSVHDFLPEQSQHSDTVFQLDIPVISSLFRQFPLRQDIPLIAGMDKMDPMALIVDLLPFFDQIDHLTGIFLRKWLQRIKSVAVL